MTISRKTVLLTVFAMLNLIGVATNPSYNVIPELGLFLILLGIPNKAEPGS